MLTIVNEESSLMTVTEGCRYRSLTKRRTLSERSFLRKKLHATLLNVVLHEV